MFDVSFSRGPIERKPGSWLESDQFRFSHRDLEKCRPRCVAGRPGVGVIYLATRGLLVGFIAPNPVSFA
jgi:hypothetical protein